MGSGDINISAFIRAPCIKCFLEVPETLRNILDYLGGVDTPVDRVLVPRNLANLSKYMGGEEVNISASIRAHAPNFVWRFLRHIGIF